jgi:DDB1- and CUL4-associated factor 7
MAASAATSSGAGTSTEILQYDAPWPLYGLGWSSRTDRPPRIAIGSFVEEYSNKVEIVQQGPTSLQQVCSFDHSYPATKVAWMPDEKGVHPELLGTTGDFLRIWEIGESGRAKSKCVLNNVRISKLHWARNRRAGHI